MSEPNDLNALTKKALQEIEHTESLRACLQGKRRSSLFKPQLIGTLLVLVLAIYSVSDKRSHRYWLGVSEQQQIAEMSAALTAANLAVDRSHSTTGEWPDRVPLPALAALVELQNPGPNYRLLARSERWLLTMSASGDLQKAQP